MTQRALLFVRVPPVSIDIESAWTRWYDHEHIAHRLSKPGFVGARRYRADDGPQRHLALYELADPSALASEAYLAHRRWEEAQELPRFEAIAPRMPAFRRGVYRHRAPEHRGYIVPDCDSLLIVDLDTADALIDGPALDAFVAALEGVNGACAARVVTLMTSTAPGTGQHTGGPMRLAMIDVHEVTRRLFEVLELAWTERVRPNIANISILARRAYSSFHE